MCSVHVLEACCRAVAIPFTAHGWCFIPQVLKDKFDDIFAATKYTKALESLAKLKKEKAQEVCVDFIRTCWFDMPR